jgi:ferritin-like metal-binding protein YciE
MSSQNIVGGIPMTKLALRELYINELKDLSDAENRLLRAIPKMARRAESDDLRVGFEKHFEQTKGHLERLREILEGMGEKATGKKCAAMTGLIKEGDEMMEEEFDRAREMLRSSRSPSA